MIETEMPALSEEEKLLVELRDDIYDGYWTEMVADLEDRLKEDGCFYKLKRRITLDLKRIENLRKNHPRL